MKDLPESEDFFFMTGSAGMNIKRDPHTSGEEDEQEQANCRRAKDPDYHRFFSYFGYKDTDKLSYGEIKMCSP